MRIEVPSICVQTRDRQLAHREACLQELRRRAQSASQLPKLLQMLTDAFDKGMVSDNSYALVLAQQETHLSNQVQDHFHLHARTTCHALSDF